MVYIKKGISGKPTYNQAKKTPKGELAKLACFGGIQLRKGIQEMCTSIMYAHILCYEYC